MKIMKVGEVFVAGGQPTVTYNPRTSVALQTQLEDYLDARFKLLAICGPTKSGKTVLVRERIPRDRSVVIMGGEVTSATRFWELVVDQLNGFTSISDVSQDKTTTTDGNARDVAIKPSGIGVQVASQRQTATERSESRTLARSSSPDAIGPELLRSAKIPLIIDDFHYVDRATQTSIVRALKDPIFEGIPVICLSTSHRGFDAVHAEPEMTGRVKLLPIPPWTEAELVQIATSGFAALNVEADPSLAHILQDETFGSPHLMQEFCGAYCRVNGVRETSAVRQRLPTLTSPDKFFAGLSDTGAVTALNDLTRGPLSRSDRIDRNLRNGRVVDIYELVLIALAHTGPKLKLQYEELRTALKEITNGDPPQVHEVTRVIQHMVKIAKKRTKGEPVMDWTDNREVYITDPFFAYALRWTSRFNP